MFSAQHKREEQRQETLKPFLPLHVFEHSAVVKADPPQKNRRIPGIDNVQREAGRCMRKSFSIIQESTCS